MRKLAGVCLLSVPLAMAAASSAMAAGTISNFEITIPGQTFTVSDKEKVLSTINQWREEAIKNDDFLFSSKYKLSYTPLVWNEQLENVSKIRAAETTVLPDHLNLNGKTSPFAEVLSWNKDVSFEGALNSWYAERAKYLENKAEFDAGRGNREMIGHYFNLVNPNSKYFGMAGFKADTAISENPGGMGAIQNNWGSIAGELSRNDQPTTEVITEASKHVFTVSPTEIAKQDPTGTQGFSVDNLTNTSPVALGEDSTGPLSATVNIHAEYDGPWVTTVPVVSGKWESSNPAVISVENQTMTAKQTGDANVSLSLGDDLTVTTETKVVEGTPTINEQYPFLVPVKEEATKALEKLQAFTEKERAVYQEKIDNATSKEVVRDILAAAQVANVEKAKEIQKLESVKDKAQMEIQMYFMTAGVDSMTILEKMAPYQDAVKEATSVAEINAILENMKEGKPPLEKPEKEPEQPTPEPDPTPVTPDPPAKEETGNHENSDGKNQGNLNQNDSGDQSGNIDSGSQNSDSNPNTSTEGSREDHPSDNGTGEGNNQSPSDQDSNQGSNQEADGNTNQGQNEGDGSQGDHESAGDQDNHQGEQGGDGDQGEHIDQGNQGEQNGDGHEEPETVPAPNEEQLAKYLAYAARMDREAKGYLVSKAILSQEIGVTQGQLAAMLNRMDGGLWATASGHSLKSGADEVKSNGATVGYDKVLRRGMVGVAAGYDTGSVTLGNYERSINMSTSVKTASASVYGKYTPGNWVMGTLVSVKKMHVDDGGDLTARTAGLQVGYTVKVADKWTFTPGLDAGVIRSHHGDLEQGMSARYYGLSVGMRYMHSKTVSLTSQWGMQKVRFGGTVLHWPEMSDSAHNFETYTIPIHVKAVHDTRYYGSIGVQAALSPNFSLEGNVGYSKYKESGLKGATYGVQASYKF